MQRRKITPGFIGFIILALTIAVVSYITSFGHFTNLAYLCGYGFGSAGLIYILGIALFRKYPKSNVALVAFLIAVPLTIKDQYQELKTSLDLRQFISDVKSSEDISTAIGRSQTRMASALRVIVQTNEKTNNELLSIFTDYESPFYNSLLDIKNMQSREFISSILSKLEQDRNTLNNNILRIPNIFSEEKNNINRGLSFFNDNEKKFIQNIKDGNERTRASDMSFVTDRANIALSVFDNIIDLFKFMADKSSEIYQDSSGKIIFKSNSDAQKYNDYISGIQTKSAQEEQLVENYNNSLVDRQTKMNKLMNFELP